jgi:hypothetical protein
MGVSPELAGRRHRTGFILDQNQGSGGDGDKENGNGGFSECAVSLVLSLSQKRSDCLGYEVALGCGGSGFDWGGWSGEG